MLSNMAREVFHQSIPLIKQNRWTQITLQIDNDPVAKDNEYDFTTEKEIFDTDTTDSEWEEADDRNAFDIFDEQRLFPI